MKYLFFAILIISPFLLKAQKVRFLNETAKLIMPKESDGPNSGTRGASIAWNASEKKYYAAFAGNESYPLAVFNNAGHQLSDDDLKCMQDIRGLWYNHKSKAVYGKVHKNNYWFTYILNDKGLPTDYEIRTKAAEPSGGQSIAAYNKKKDIVYFLSGRVIKAFDANGKLFKEAGLKLHPGITRSNDTRDVNSLLNLGSDYNKNVLIYTGNKKAEFGILNHSKKQIELYNKKNGLLTQILKLPKNAKTYSGFSFSYANGIYWLFNQTTRTWVGYE